MQIAPRPSLVPVAVVLAIAGAGPAKGATAADATAVSPVSTVALDGTPPADDASARGGAAQAAGRPTHSWAIPALEIVGFDLALNLVNRATDDTGTYDVTWDSIRRNLKGPWVTDSDPFDINQFAHPYQGSMYHGFARSMGLDYWQSSALTFAGSAWWEITGETTPPSINDQVASGIAGSFFGEPLFRMAHLVSDRSTLPAGWRPWATALVSPPVALNRAMFGPDAYGAQFDDHDPAYYGRAHLGYAHATVMQFQPSSGVDRDTAEADFQMDYGLPGKPGYTYDRPFDYFNFQATLSSSNGVENLTSNGMLLGMPYHWGPSFQGIWGLYGGYEYLAPQVYHYSSTSLSLGSTAQWNIAPDWALQGTLTGGFGYAAASSTVHDVDNPEYHYGMAPRGSLSLRLVEGHRFALETAGRIVSLGTIANRDAGRDDISRLESALTWRFSGHQAIGINYVWQHRSAAFPSGERQQTLGQVGVFWTILGQQDFGVVDWK
jgi:hypothetical protein